MASSPLNVNPLTLDFKQVWELVSPLFKNILNINDQLFNSDALFTNVVSDIFIRSLRISIPNIELNLPDIQIDKTKPAQLEPPIALLKQLVCQMRGTKREDLNHVEAYRTTKEILEKQLISYPWNAKAVIVLSAFALEYGNLWNLYEQMMKISSTVGGDSSLGYSLAVLNKVRVDTANKDISEYNVVVKDVFETVGLIVKLQWFTNKYGGNKYPPARTLEKVMYERPCFIFWIILTIVVLSSQLDVLLGAPKYKLSDIGSMISSKRTQLDDYLVQIRKEADFIDEYQHRDYVVFQAPTEIVESVRCLLFPLDLKAPQVYDGSTESMVSIEVFRNNFVLVFISGLHSIDDETYLLNKIYEDLKQSDPRIVKAIKKDDFKILWVPFLEEPDRSVGDTNKKFLEMRRKMKWHVMDYSIIPDPMCKMLIQNRLSYKNNPIVPLFDPKGAILNVNSLHMLFTWGIQAFPWREGDDEETNKRWNWLWKVLKENNPEIIPWTKSDTYIIIWGHSDSKFFDDQWLMKMGKELDRIKRDNEIIRLDIHIEYCHHAKRASLKELSSFWSNVEATFEAQKRAKKEKFNLETYQEVCSFLELRPDHTGWVLLSKGSNVRYLCRGDIFLETLSKFDSWKGNIERDGGFDESLKKCCLMLDRQRCSHVLLRNPLVDISDPIICSRCTRTMTLSSAEFVCCHGEKDEDTLINIADNVGGYVEIQR